MPRVLTILLLAAMALFAWPPAPPVLAAGDVPPHLAAFAAQLVKANRARLTRPPPSTPAGEAAIIGKGYRALKRATIHLWSAGRAPVANALPPFARALGLKHPDGRARAALARVLATWTGKDDPRMIARLRTELGLDPLPEDALAKLVGKLAGIREQTFGKLARHHTIEVDDTTEIELDWPGPGHDATLTVIGKGGNGEPPFELELRGKVSLQPSADGKTLEAAAEPDAKAPLAALDARALAKRRKDIGGIWYDQKSREWRIEVGDGAGGPVGISYSNGPKLRIRFDEAQLRRRKITARRLYHSIADLKRNLPIEIKRQLVNNPSAYERLELTFFPATPPREARLEGVLLSGTVTYDPSSYAIDNITPDVVRKPLVLTREKTSRKYRIGKLTVDLVPLRMRLQDVEMQIGKTRERMETLKEFDQEEKARIAQLKKQLASSHAGEKEASAAIARLERAIADLQEPPTLKPTERQALETLRRRIGEAELKQDAGVLTSSEAVILRQDRRLLTDLERRLAAKRPAPYRTRAAFEARLKELRAQIAQRRDRLLALRFRRAGLASDLDHAADRRKALAQERAILEKTLAHYEKLRKRLKSRPGAGTKKGRSIEWIRITAGDDDKVVYSAVAQEKPYDDAFRAFEREIAEAREEVEKARLLRNRARNMFLYETRRAIELGDELADTILSSARAKRNVAVAKIAAGVIKDFVKGGPVAAAGGAVFKLLVETPALNLAEGRGAFERKQVSTFDETALRRQMEAAYRAGLKKSLATPSLTDEFARIAGKRGRKVLLSTALKDKTKALVLRNGFGRWAQRMAVRGRAEDLSAFLKANARNAWLKRALVRRRADFLKKLMSDLEKLKAPNPASGLRGHLSALLTRGGIRRMAREFDFKKAVSNALRKSPGLARKIGQSAIEGLVLDMAEAMINRGFEAQEQRAWIAYLTQDIIARSLYPAYQEAHKHYWEAVDMLHALEEARNTFLTEVDRESNYRIERNAPFPADATLRIRLYVPTGDPGKPLAPIGTGQASVAVDGRQAAAKPYYEGVIFTLDAKRIDRQDGARLPLTITLK